MRKSWLFHIIFTSIILLACSKSQDDAQIDVSKQDKIDYSGNAISWLNDGQWESKVFTTQEESLFNGLDTANLAGTIMPDSIVVSSSTFFPNPFGSQAILAFAFSPGYNGQLELKYVIVDGHMKIKDIGALRIQATANQNFPLSPSVSSPIQLAPNLPVGQYRIYFTLSAQSKANFYKTWGNIQKTS